MNIDLLLRTWSACNRTSCPPCSQERVSILAFRGKMGEWGCTSSLLLVWFVGHQATRPSSLGHTGTQPHESFLRTSARYVSSMAQARSTKLISLGFTWKIHLACHTLGNMTPQAKLIVLALSCSGGNLQKVFSAQSLVTPWLKQCFIHVMWLAKSLEDCKTNF